jgi:hypothetical protein
MFEWVEAIGTAATDISEFVDYAYVELMYLEMFFYALFICVFAILIMLIVVLVKCHRIERLLKKE